MEQAIVLRESPLGAAGPSEPSIWTSAVGRSGVIPVLGVDVRSMGERGAFDELCTRVKGAVDRELGVLLDARVERARVHGQDLETLVSAVRSLAMRGGKRFRAVLVAAAYEGAGGATADDVVLAGVSMELLQTYLLIHDDVMDGDEMRRGGPSVHAMLRERFGSARAGESGAILAGDLARALSADALLRVPLAAARVAEAARELARMEEDVVCGQLLDMRAAAKTDADVETMHALKTASYTVRGPLLVGAALGGASDVQRAGLERFARPLGIAFQLRDDLLGTFGDPRLTGKPLHSDLRSRKRTALALALEKDAEGAALLAEEPTDQACAKVVRRMVESGVKRRVEERLLDLTREALSALDGLELAGRSRAVLAGAVKALGNREH